MNRSISKTELENVKRAISDAEKGQATLEQLARAHSIAERARASSTIGILRSHIRAMTPNPARDTMLMGIVTGTISGIIVWLLFGRRGKVDFA